MIRECLDLRKKYVYRERVVPWRVETIAEHTLSKNSDPFHFEPVEATSHHFKMEDGVIHVYANENDTEDLFPVASSTMFFFLLTCIIFLKLCLLEMLVLHAIIGYDFLRRNFAFICYYMLIGSF